MVNVDWNVALKRLFSGPTAWRKRSIMNLPNDILVDNIFSLLNVEELVAVRRVSQTFYVLSHHPTLWTRFLRELNLSVPPLPPSIRYKGRNFAEEMVIRSISVDDNWRSNKTRTFDVKESKAHHEVQSMKILAGGKYMIASVRDLGPEGDYALMVFVMDDPERGAIPLAKTVTRSKPYDLQAKYISHQGEKGIMISYVRREIHDRKTRHERNIDPNEFSDNHKIDPPVPLRYECTTLHISLASLDTLNQPTIRPGTKEWAAFANSLPPPFQTVNRMRSGYPITGLTLESYALKPYLAVIRRPRERFDEIVLRDLQTGHAATFITEEFRPAEITAAAASLEFPNYDCSVQSIRILPGQRQLLVVRQYELTGAVSVNLVSPNPDIHGPWLYPNIQEPVYHSYAVELYDIPLDTPDKAKVVLSAVQRYVVPNRQATRFHISENYQPTPDDTSSYHGLPFNEGPPPPISIYAEIRNPQSQSQHGMMHMSLWPRANKISTSGWAYDLVDLRTESRFDAHKNDVVRVVPGAIRALIYTHHEKDRSAEPRLLELRRYNNCETKPAECPEPVETQTIMRPRALLPQKLFGTIEVPLKLRERLQRDGLKAIAFDESIGRVCIAAQNDSVIHVLDFAQMPSVPSQYHATEKIVAYGDPTLYPVPDERLVPFRRHGASRFGPFGSPSRSDNEDDFDYNEEEEEEVEEDLMCEDEDEEEERNGYGSSHADSDSGYGTHDERMDP